MKKILVIAAHPDDEIYGMGGTIARLNSEGKEIYLLIVTDGSTSQYREADNIDDIIKEKKLETKAAAKIVGIKQVFYGNLPDMRLDQTDHIKINSVIEETIDKVNPDTVFTHYWGDVNLDHRRVYESTMVSTRPTFNQCVKEVYCYNVPSSTEWEPAVHHNFSPNYFVDISEYTQKKQKAIKAYKTELREFPHPRSLKYVEAQDVAVGLRYGIKNCEEFILIRKVI